MESLKDPTLNQTSATATVLVAGGVVTWSRTYN